MTMRRTRPLTSPHLAEAKVLPPSLKRGEMMGKELRRYATVRQPQRWGGRFLSPRRKRRNQRGPELLPLFASF